MSKALNISNISLTNKYLLWLSSLNKDVKLGIIEGLCASMQHKKSKEATDLDFVDKLSGAWDDGISTEEKMREIRNTEYSLLQRDVETW